MADLPRYQSTGRVFADVPQLDFANVRESFKQSQSMSNALDKLSSFAFDKAKEVSVQQAVEFSANNAPTPEQIELAKRGEFNPKDLVPGGGAIFQKAVQKLQADQLRNSLEIDLQGQYVNILNDVKNNKITSKQELDAKLAAPVAGMNKVISSLDPESGIKFKAAAAAHGFQINVAANKQFEENFRIEKDVETTKATDSSIAIIRQTHKNLGTSNPELLKQQIDLNRTNISKAGANGTAKHTAEKLKAYDDELEGLAISGLDSTKENVIRLGASGNPKAEKGLSLATKEMSAYADAMGISPQYREKFILSTIEDFHVARLEADYDKAPNKQAFLQSLQKDIKKGAVGPLFDDNGNPIKSDRLSRGIDLPKLNALTNQFEADIRSRKAEYTASVANLKSDITEMNRISSLGSTVPEYEISSLQKRAQSLGLPSNDITVQRINSLTVLNADTNSFKKMNDVQLSNTLRQWQSETKNGATLIQAERINNLTKYKSAFVEGLNKDPVSMMNRAGMDVKTLDLSLPDKDFKLQVSDRVQNAKIFATHHGIKPQFLTSDEASAISTYIASADTDSQMGMLKKIQTSFGKDAYTVLGQISKTAPEYAHIAGMMSVGVPSSTIKDALVGIKQQQAGNKVVQSEIVKNSIISNSLGNAFSKLPTTRSNVIKTADAIYTNRAIQSGNTDSFNETLYRDSLQEAAGAVRTASGSDWWGGIYKSTKGNSHMIPTNVRQSEFQTIVDKATFDDFQFAANGKLTDEKGRPYSASKLRDAYLMEDVTQDNMRLYYGKPDSATAQQFYTQDGQPVVINYRKLVDRVKGK